MITDNDWDDALSGELVRVEQAIERFQTEGEISSLIAYKNLWPDDRTLSLEQALVLTGSAHSRGFHTANFPSEILRLKHLTYLDLGLTEAETLPDLARFFPSLVHLSIHAPSLTTLGLSWEELPKLETIALSTAKLQSLPGAFGACPYLEHFSVTFSELRAFPCGTSQVKQLNFWANPLLTEFPTDPNAFAHCELLRLGKTSIAQLPDNPDLFPALRELDLADTPVQTLPPSVSEWGDELTIDLRKSQLSSLPESLLSSRSIRRIQIRGTPLAKLFTDASSADEALRAVRTRQKRLYYQLSKGFKIEL
jgi:Leucine-rich repeat (LRR) protein